MYEFIYNETRKARKLYNCNSCEHLVEFGQDEAFFMLDGDAKKRWLELQGKAWKIQPGDFYVYEVYNFDGEICVARYLPIAHVLCQILDCYPRY